MKVIIFHKRADFDLISKLIFIFFFLQNVIFGIVNLVTSSAVVKKDGDMNLLL